VTCLSISLILNLIYNIVVPDKKCTSLFDLLFQRQSELRANHRLYKVFWHA